MTVTGQGMRYDRENLEFRAACSRADRVQSCGSGWLLRAGRPRARAARL